MKFQTKIPLKNHLKEINIHIVSQAQ